MITDGGPCFQGLFLEYLDSMYIQHRYSSAYRPQSNSPAERNVRSLKDVLEKMPSINDKVLRTIVFNINNHQAPDGSGSPAMRFFKRRIRSGLPTAIEREVNFADLMKIRAKKHKGIAEKKGRKSSDEFVVGDEVRVQCQNTKTWTKVGKIKAARKADDEQDVSFVIQMENGRESIRHRSHLRHNVTRYTKVVDTKVRFDIPDETADDKRSDEEIMTTRKRGRPKKGEEPNKEPRDVTGVASRTRSKSPTPNSTENQIPDSTSLPERGILKKRSQSA